jgi:hypothetical protein
MDIKPTFTNLSEGIFNDFFKAADPTLLTSVEFDLSNAGTLNLFELFNSKSLSLNGNIVNAVILQQLVALSSNINHSLNNFLLNK